MSRWFPVISTVVCGVREAFPAHNDCSVLIVLVYMLWCLDASLVSAAVVAGVVDAGLVVVVGCGDTFDC